MKEELLEDEISLVPDQEDYLDEQWHLKKESDAGAWASLIMGIVGSLGWIIPIIGLPVTIVGTVFGAINMKSRKSKGVAIAGFIINLVFMLVAIAKGIVDIVIWAKRNKKA